MVLLHWCTVSPQGPSSLAAIRFVTPTRVSSIRIFPNGAQPFSQSPEVVACTEPEAFFLEIFFNAHPIHQSESKDKQRASNALVPTTIAYAGGLVDFTVDMGTEYATRLMIVKGKFEKLSMAIYGEVVSESPMVQVYEQKNQPVLEPLPLPSAIDPSGSSDPTRLATQLLSLISNPPPLSLVIRLMFCLKPSNEDWDHPDFPYLYVDLENEDEEFDLEGIIQSTARPAPEDVSEDVLSKFAVRVVDLVGPKSSEQCYQIAKILSISASQCPGMAISLLQQLDLVSIFDDETMTEKTVLCLFDATANADIARHFLQNADFVAILQDVQENPRSDKHTQLAMSRLLSRIRGWESFEDALSNTRGDFITSANLLKEIGTEENSFGVWLESMIIHPDIVTKLAEIPVLPISQSNVPLLFRISPAPVSHDEFIAFVRALIGVASVLAVWAWADSVGSDILRERTLVIMKLWQVVDGYREILNHLLLLRQLTRRLGWIISDNDTPRKSGILAEQLLLGLTQDPRAVLQDELVKTILSLEPPLSYIAESERLSLRKIALVSEDGLPAAVEYLNFTSDRPFSHRRLRTLRVSLAIVERELLRDSRGEWRILQTFWDEQTHGIIPRLIKLVTEVVDDINQHFAIQPTPTMQHALSELLFRTADDLLRLIMHLVHVFPPTSRTLRNLTIGIADLFACTDLADMIFSQSSSACASAQSTRQTCLNVIRNLSGPTSYAEPSKLGAGIILRTLFVHASRTSGRDPAYHILQVYSLIDHMLPDMANTDKSGEELHWVTSVFPTVLDELKVFFRSLDTENQVHLVKRLAELDNDLTGIGEWLLMEELKHLSSTLHSLTSEEIDAIHLQVQLYQVNLSLRFLVELVSPPSDGLTWWITALSSNSELSQIFTGCLNELLNKYYTSSTLIQLVGVLAKHVNSFEFDTRFTILLCLLRAACTDPTSPYIFDYVVNIAKDLPPPCIIADTLRLELGCTLTAFTVYMTSLDIQVLGEIISLLESVLQKDVSKLTILCGIKSSTLSQFFSDLSTLLPEREFTITDICSKFTVDEDEVFTPTAVELPDVLKLSLQDIENIMQPQVEPPSTPKAGNKTPDILGTVISPPTALLRSPAATGLTKTYANNDFRQLRQVPSARLNTSRLPSLHVDDFENPSTALAPAAPIMPEVSFGGLLHM